MRIIHMHAAAFHVGSKFPDLKKTSVKSLLECCEACSTKAPKCATFTYEPMVAGRASTNCWLHDKSDPNWSVRTSLVSRVAGLMTEAQ